MSEGMSQITAELTSRYGVLPLLPFEDVWMDERGRVFLVRVRSDSGDPDDYDIETRRPRRDCKKCYELGYENVFYSNDKQFNGHPLLTLCRCLRQDPDIQKVYDAIVAEEEDVASQDDKQEHVIKANPALPKLKASANFREVAPSGGATKASISDVIKDNTIGTADNV